MKTDRSAGIPPAAAGASRPRFGAVEIHNRGHLPHWEMEGATYIVTLRLADSLPKCALDQIEAERHAIVTTAKQLARQLTSDERKRIQELSSKRVEQYLDSGAGACHLRSSEIAGAVARAVAHFDNKRYRLFAWCIMPNHVHVVVRIFPGWSLASVVHSWKSFTAKQANQFLKSKGGFWQREYYDHLIRNDAEFERAVRYVGENPDKAGLKLAVGLDAGPRSPATGGATES